MRLREDWLFLVVSFQHGYRRPIPSIPKLAPNGASGLSRITVAPKACG